MLFLVLLLWPQLQKPEVYCLCQQVFLYSLNYQNWACWNCWNSCLKQVSLLLGAYSQCLFDCPKTLLVLSKPTAKILSPGTLNSWHQLQKQPDFWLWSMPCMAVAYTCLAHCLNCITPFQPTAGSPSLASILSHAVKTLRMCHCPSCDLLEMQRAWLLFLKPETVVSFS